MSILSGRFVKNGFDLNRLKGRTAIDIGCGSGRFTIALKKMGCDKVTGVDFGDDGLALARDMVDKTGTTGVDFRKVDVLNLPFPDASFDFVFSSGVQHHTENMERGIGEMVRVAKKGALLWLYLYGDGGFFWYTRKKMPLVMKNIPQSYSLRVLDLIGMPTNREMFADNWYVPLERHTTDREARAILADLGITKITRHLKGYPTDLEHAAYNSGEAGRIMWGDGELRYMMEK